MNQPNHTPTPWQISSANAFHRAMIFAYPAHKQTAVAALTEGDNADANAAHIVRCVNSHDELVAALEWLVNCADPNNDGELDRTKDVEHAIEQACAALAKVAA